MLKLKEGEWPAALQMLKENCRMRGAVIGLSRDGCYFRTTQLFKGVVQIHVEVDLNVRGLHLRLAGVVEEVRDKRTVAIRFLELSYRKRAELADLIEELRQEAKSQSSLPL